MWTVLAATPPRANNADGMILVFGDAHGFGVGAEDRADGVGVGMGFGARVEDGLAVVAIVVFVAAWRRGSEVFASLRILAVER